MRIPANAAVHSVLRQPNALALCRRSLLPFSPVNGLSFATSKDLNRRLQRIYRLAIWIPEDKMGLRLYRNGREEDIETGSAGQRTAAM